MLFRGKIAELVVAIREGSLDYDTCDEIVRRLGASVKSRRS